MFQTVLTWVHLLDKKYFWLFALLILLGECLFSFLIIQKVPYTEIDWIAYMEEVTGFLGGDTDYVNLKGQTGPLVYPAGFVYLYSLLYYATNLGENIRLAQYIFAGLYVFMIAILFLMYRKGSRFNSFVLTFYKKKKKMNFSCQLLDFQKNKENIFKKSFENCSFFLTQGRTERN